jgi:hypothetical protein
MRRTAAVAFTLSVDGVTIGTQPVSVRGPVSIPWPFGSTANVNHTVAGTVRGATGNTGCASLTVTVKS